MAAQCRPSPTHAMAHSLENREALRDGEDGLLYNNWSPQEHRQTYSVRLGHHGRKPGAANLTPPPTLSLASSRLGISGPELTFPGPLGCRAGVLTLEPASNFPHVQPRLPGLSS